MARGGIFGRIGRAITRFRAPPAPPERPPPPPPPEPPEPTGPNDRDYRRIWRDEHGGRKFQKHLDVFKALVDPITQDEPEARPELWESYIKHMVKGEGRFRRNDPQNMFWRDTGIDPLDFNWHRWRIAMGYTGNRRSRTP